MRVGIDAHKMKCTTVMFDGDSVTGSFDFARYCWYQLSTNGFWQYWVPYCAQLLP